MENMSEQARKLAEENVRLAHKAAWDYIKANGRLMRELGWTADDVHSEAMLALCKAAMKYDGRCGKFSTYYIVVFTHGMFQCFRRENASKRKAEHSALRLDAPINGETEKMMAELIMDARPSLEDMIVTRESVREVMDGMSIRDLKVMRLYAAGVSQQKIAEHMGISQSHVCRLLKKFRRRIA